MFLCGKMSSNNQPIPPNQPSQEPAQIPAEVPVPATVVPSNASLTAATDSGMDS